MQSVLASSAEHSVNDRRSNDWPSNKGDEHAEFQLASSLSQSEGLHFNRTTLNCSEGKMHRILVSYLALCIVIASASSCGPETTEPEASDNSVGETQQAVCGPGGQGVCVGWSNGGRRCLANCSGTNYWMDTGAAYWFSINACYPIDYGQCEQAARNFCSSRGWSYQASCWGWRS